MEVADGALKGFGTRCGKGEGNVTVEGAKVVVVERVDKNVAVEVAKGVAE